MDESTSCGVALLGAQSDVQSALASLGVDATRSGGDDGGGSGMSLQTTILLLSGPASVLSPSYAASAHASLAAGNSSTAQLYVTSNVTVMGVPELGRYAELDVQALAGVECMRVWRSLCGVRVGAGPQRRAGLAGTGRCGMHARVAQPVWGACLHLVHGRARIAWTRYRAPQMPASMRQL